MKYKGVVFDFNGTLFWDTQLHNRAWDIFLEKRNMYLTEQELFGKIHGKNNEDIFKSLFENISEEQIKAFISEKEGIYRQLCLQTEMEMAPGVIPFLKFLKNNNIPFTIATASGRENLDFYFEYLPLSEWFDFDKVVYNNGKIKSKPDPEIYNIAMNAIGQKSEDVVVFEDANMGLLAAKRAGAGRIIAVNSNDDDYSDWSDCQIIRTFDEVDRSLFI